MRFGSIMTSMRLHEARLTELALNEQLFSSGTMPPDPIIAARLDLVVQLLQFGRDIVVITGPAGVGVRRLLTELELRPDTGLRPLMLDGRDRPTANDICQDCVKHFELPAASIKSGPPAVGRVAEGLDWLARTGERPALLVNHAGALDDATLEILLGLQNDDAREYLGPALLFAGEPELEHRLRTLTRRPAGMPRLQVFHLEPWTVEQVAQYVKQELGRAGGVGGPVEALLDPEAIHLQSGGLPERVRAACQQSLAGAYPSPDGVFPRQSAGWTASRHATAVLATALLLSMVVMFFVLRPGEVPSPAEPNQVLLQPEPAPGEAPPGSGREPATEGDGELAGGAPDAIPDWRLRGKEGPDPRPDREAPSTPAEVDHEKPAAPIGGIMDPGWAPPPSARSLTAPDEAVSGAEPAAGAPDRPPEATAGVTSSTDAAPEDDSTGDAGTAAGDGDWLADRPAGHYTVQLVAGHNPKALELFITNQAQGLSAQLLRTQRDGRDWYVVITGDYPDRARARAALEALPPELREEGAWIRTLGSLQESRH